MEDGMASRKLYTVGQTDQGSLLYATQQIDPCQRILTFQGPRLTYARVARLANPDYALQIGANSYIFCMGNGRYVNHSCEPNAGIKNNVDLVAITRIGVDDEITMDYSTTMDRLSECDFECTCGTASCRKTVTGFATLPADLRERYLDLGIVQKFLRKD